MEIILKTPDAVIPDEGMYYIVAGNGIFLRKEMDWVRATVPVPRIIGLEQMEATATLLLPPLNSFVFAKAVLFFKAVFARQRTEAAVLLHFSPEKGWALSVPAQSATHSNVKYEMKDRLPGYRCVGTMHSHGDMSAFHSGTDVFDEAGFDGVHVTIGKLDRFPHFAIDAEIVVNGTRFPLPHETFTSVTPVKQKKGKFLKKVSRFFKGIDEPLFTMPFEHLGGWRVPYKWLSRVKDVGWKPSVKTNFLEDNEPDLPKDSSSQRQPWQWNESLFGDVPCK